MLKVSPGNCTKLQPPSVHHLCFCHDIDQSVILYHIAWLMFKTLIKVSFYIILHGKCIKLWACHDIDQSVILYHFAWLMFKTLGLSET